MGMYVFVELFFFKFYFNIKLEILLYCMNIKVIINIYKMLFFFIEVYCCNSDYQNFCKMEYIFGNMLLYYNKKKYCKVVINR